MIIYHLIFFPPGLICILDIDIQGVKSIKETDISCNYIFVQPPSMEILKERLQGELDDSLHGRLQASGNIDDANCYRYLSLNLMKCNSGRGTETEDSLQKRLNRATEDLE